MPEKVISHEQAKALRHWIVANGGKSLTDDMIGGRAYTVDGEPVTITTTKVGEGTRTWKAYISQPIAERVSADRVFEPKQP